MIEYFQYKLIAVALLLLILIIFFILKSKKNEENKVVTQKKPEKLVLQEEEDEDDDYNTLEGSEEGDFGSEMPQEVQTDTIIKQIAKRTVPAHEKITKQNFTEFSGTRVLVAEDNLINQKVITGLLAGSGIDLVMADNGEEALNILEKDSNFLMVLMDAHMPVMDGFEATRAIRSNPNYNHILVVALSGDTAADDIRKMQEAGMAEQLEKPLHMDALYDILYAYSGEKQSIEDANIIEVINTKELDGEKGLTICSGDEVFYNEILKEFVENYTNSSQKIEQLLQNNELEHVDRILLDIIGITANIGADTLNKIAKEFKARLNDANEKSYLTLMEQYNIHLKQLLLDINKYK